MVTLVWIDDEDNVRQVEVENFTKKDVCKAIEVSYEDIVSQEEAIDTDEEIDYYEVVSDSVYTTILFQFVSTDKWVVVGPTEQYVGNE